MVEKITDTVSYIGADDPELRQFEGQYHVPNGMAYNSYFIDGPVTAVMDGVDHHKVDEWLKNIDTVLDGRSPDYLVVHHMEPDHSGSIGEFVAKYPNAKVVMSQKAKNMVPNFFDKDFSDRVVVVGEGDTLDLGDRKLHFINAPMVHWPEVVMSYDDKDKILFSADGFGKFGTHNLDEPWDDEARRYYINIVGKYGPQVQSVLKKAANLDIEKILPVHGPYLTEDLGKYIGLYDKWSSYTPEVDGVFIAVASAHGHTYEAAKKMKEILESKGAEVSLLYLNTEDVHEAVARAYKYSKLLLMANSYDAGVFPPMERFLNILSHKNFQNRAVGFIQNGSWAPTATKTMKEILAKNKNLRFVEPEITIKTSMKESTIHEMEELADNLIKAE